VPTDSAAVLNVATPEPLSDALPSDVEPSRKTMLPVATMLLLEVMLAVSVSKAPEARLVAEALSEAFVAMV